MKLILYIDTKVNTVIKLWVTETLRPVRIYRGLIRPWSDQEGNNLQLKKILMFIKRNILTIKQNTRVGTLIVATIYLQLIQNRYMFGSFTVLQCSHQHCVQPVASYVKVVGYL